MTENHNTQFPVVAEGTIGGETVQTTDGRQLHAFLKVGKDFSTWIKDRIDQYDFVENQDFTVFTEIGGNPSGGRPTKEYAVSIDMAKELAMVERNEQGKKARLYFIECERRAKAATNVHFLVPKTLPEALRLAADLAEKVETQKAVIVEMAPKVEFHDKVTEAINCQSVEEVAKVLGSGRNRMFQWLRDASILMSNNRPYQNHIDAGHFRLVEKQYTDARGESHTYTQTLVTGRGLSYIQRRFGGQAA